MREAFAWNPGFKEYFAVKATPNPTIMSILHEEGCGMDCSSLTELMLCERQGITGGDIMFSLERHPPMRTIARGQARRHDKPGRHHPHRLPGKDHRPYPETISCRFNPGGYFEISNTIMDSPGDAKYGMTKSQMFQAYRILMEKGAKEFGIHAFLASNTTTDDYYPTSPCSSSAWRWSSTRRQERT